MKPLAEESVAELLSVTKMLQDVLRRELDRENFGAVVTVAVRLDEIQRFTDDGVGGT